MRTAAALTLPIAAAPGRAARLSRSRSHTRGVAHLPSPAPSRNPQISYAAPYRITRSNLLPGAQRSYPLRSVSSPPERTAVTNVDGGGAPSHAPERAPRSTTIVGGGPAGLATAIMLAQMGYRCIQVVERLPPPPPPDSAEWGNPDRSYNLGINGRGQRALSEFGCWDRVDGRCAGVLGRLEIAADGKVTERMSSHKTVVTKVIQRDRLVACLLEELNEKYSEAVTVVHEAEVLGVDWSDGRGDRPEVEIHVRRAEGEVVIRSEFLVGADGFRSSIPAALEAASGSKFKRTVYEDTNARVYKTVFYNPPDSFRRDMNYSINSVSKEDGGMTLEALPTREGLLCGLLLFKPGNQRMAGVRSAEDARALFAEQFPQLSGHLDESEFAKFAAKPVSKLPVFQHCGSQLHRADSTVLLGDAIHTVKPYFGMGVNSAFEDVQVLKHCLLNSGHSTAEALPAYSTRHAPNALSLVKLSRGFDVGGFLFFVLPLIVDGIFHKLAPRLFAPNTIRLLQDERLTFAEIRARKQRDRALQVLCIAAMLGAAAFVVQWVVRTALRLLAGGGAALV